MIALKDGILRGTFLFGFVLLLIHATQALALGFGDIRVRSALNEPLDATLDLVSLSAREQSSLSVGVATPEMFKRFGIERSALAEELRVETSKVGNDRVSVRLTTRGPVREPFLRFLIQADTSDGAALREYTVLLDPPGTAPPRAASPASTMASSPDQPARRSARNASPARSASSLERRPAASEGANRYGPVAPGDTLFSIAEQTRRPGTSQDQMQVAIFRDNPSAFNGTMDMLLSGVTLSIPPAERVAAIDEAQARATIRAARQESVARAASSSSAEKTSTKTTATTAIEPPPPATTNATLRLEAPRVGSDSQDAGLFGRLVMPAPASTQADGDTAEPASAANPEVADDSAPGTAAFPAESQAPVAVSPDTIIESDRPSVDAATGTGIDSAPEQSTAASQQATLAPAAIDSSRPTAAPDDSLPLDASERDVVAAEGEGLLRPRNIMLLLLALVLIVLLLIWNRRRQYRPVPLSFDDEQPDSETGHEAPEPPVRDDAPVMPAPATAAHGQAPAPPAPVAASVFARQADQQIQAGAFDEARETLEHGLELHPGDATLQDKRLELDYLAGDTAGFAADVDRFGPGLAGSGVRWAGVAAMGRVLLPDDPRFQTREAAFRKPTPDESASIPPATTMPAPGRFVPGDDPAIESEEMPAVPNRQTAAEPVDPARDRGDGIELDDSLQADRKALDASTSADDITDPSAAADRSEALNLDMESQPGQSVAWQPSEVGPGRAREHDQGRDLEGLAFELDTSDDRTAGDFARRDETGRSSPPEMAPIDTSEFDLGDAGPSEESYSYGDSQTTDHSDSTGIRLDLARMYIEMEDGTAARELLEEVIAEGSEAQKAEARGLLDTL